ncbi:MAG TPA: hypothetical protein VLA19_28405 [Herpetosiphonaceae bacterium]|nr:hypothetical protein [Herpetosiphonaceae bacterium]
MDVINRAVAVIKPRQPYLDWAKSIPGPADDVTLDEVRTDCTAILIPDFDDPAEAEAFIATIAGDLFEMELDSWDRDPRTWPVNRSYAIFREWFDVEIHSIVLDASDDDLIREAY